MVGPTLGTSYGFRCGNLCFSQSDLQENTTKVLHEGGPVLHAGDSYIKKGPESKQKSSFNSFRAAKRQECEYIKMALMEFLSKYMRIGTHR